MAGEPRVTDDPTGVPRAVEARFEWRAGEFAEVMTHLSREKLRSRGWRIALGLGAIAVAWQLVRIAMYAEDVVSGAVAATPWIALIVFWTWALTRGTGWLAARRTKRLGARVSAEQVHRIDAEGLFVDTGAGSVMLPWSGMSRVAETASCFLWYWNREAAQYTPKRALSEADIGRVRALIHERAAALDVS